MRRAAARSRRGRSGCPRRVPREWAQIDDNRAMASAGKNGADLPSVTWAGHATVLLETAGSRLVTDPVLGRRVRALRRLAPPVSPAIGEDIDAVLLSHSHADHLDLPSLRRIGTSVPVVAPPAAAEVLRRRGFRSTRDVTPGSV